MCNCISKNSYISHLLSHNNSVNGEFYKDYMLKKLKIKEILYANRIKYRENYFNNQNTYKGVEYNNPQLKNPKRKPNLSRNDVHASVVIKGGRYRQLIKSSIAQTGRGRAHSRAQGPYAQRNRATLPTRACGAIDSLTNGHIR